MLKTVLAEAFPRRRSTFVYMLILGRTGSPTPGACGSLPTPPLAATLADTLEIHR